MTMRESEQDCLFLAETKQDSDLPKLRERYLHLTKSVLPEAARQQKRNWPVSQDHCFQRIVLDHVCGGVWYEQVKKPAYKHMTAQQLKTAIAMCEEMADNQCDLAALNRQSLIWRGEL